MANLKHLSWALLIVTGLMLVAHEAEATISCDKVRDNLISCVPYIQLGGVGNVSANCCSGVKSLNTEAQTTTDRQAVCVCLKESANAFPNADTAIAASIPEKCGVNIPFKLDTNTDCAKVQ